MTLISSPLIRFIVSQHAKHMVRNLGQYSWIPFYSTYAQQPPNHRKKLFIDEILPVLSEEDIQNNLAKEFSRTRGSLSSMILLRDDISSLLSSKADNEIKVDNAKKAKLKLFDKVIQQWLGSIFSLDNLELKRITFDSSSGIVLEKVARGESVHRVRSLSELKRRLHDGKRCFGLFHPSLPDEPLVFIHVALTTEISKTLASLDQTKTEYRPTHAIFYSVNSPLTGLRGLDIASLLIKEVASTLPHHFRSIQTFSTLSPIPKFMTWLEAQGKQESVKIPLPSGHENAIRDALLLYNPSMVSEKNIYKALHNMLSDSTHGWIRNLNIQNRLKDPLLWLGSYYIAKEKIMSGSQALPYDDVARFHLRNGAKFYSINWMGNPSENGLKTSAGMMINYLYDLAGLEENAKEFLNRQDNLPIGPIIEEILTTK